MTITEYSIKNKVISWLFVVLLLVGGVVSFTNLGQLEFPEFPIPMAMVNTLYPGASPEQVEEEVTLPLERAIEELEYVKHITSISSAGTSQIIVELYDDYPSEWQEQIWDEMRRKVVDTQLSLPPGVMPPFINDNFNDVFGILFNISGSDYSYRELEDYGNILRRELTLIDGVEKVSLAGLVSEQVVIEMSQSKMASLGIDPNLIYSLIQNQNTVSNAGRMLIHGQQVRIHPTGEFDAISELEHLIISVPGSTELVYLADIADIYISYEESPRNLYRSNGEKRFLWGFLFPAALT